MFSRASVLDQNIKQINQNLKTDEVFEYVIQKNHNKIKDYFSNPDYKVWQLKDENGYTILHKAVFNNDIETTQLILNEFKKRLGMKTKDALPKFINEKTNEGLTALHYASYKGNIKLLQLLIQSGASVEAVTNLGKNIIHMAAEGNQPSMMIYLISKEHQSSQSVDENGSTPLHWACYAGAEEAVNFLLNLEANINAQDKEKLTPLHLAVLGDRENIVLKLLQKNADKNIPNVRGELPIDLARKKNKRKIEMILDDDNDINPLCSTQTPNNYVEPSDIYKRFILLMIIIPEVIIYLFILPYLKDWIETIINFPAFGLCLLSYFLFIGKDPGYKKNSQLIKEARGEYPLLLKVNEGIDVRHFCPKCFIQKSNNIKHCFICDKCVEEFNHHCFWINKCIGKNNRLFYFIFIFSSLLYGNHAIYLCLELLWDDVNLPYDSKKLHVYLFDKERGYRVLGAASVCVFAVIVCLPLWFIFLIEILKKFECFGNKKYDDSSLENLVKRATKNLDIKPALELQGKEDALLPDEDKEQFIKTDNNNDLINNNIEEKINDDKNNIKKKNNEYILENIEEEKKENINDIQNNEKEKILPEGEIKPSIIPLIHDEEGDEDIKPSILPIIPEDGN